MEEVIELIIRFFVDNLISHFVNFVKGGILNGVNFTYHFAQNIPDPPSFKAMLPSLDVFTGLSAVLRVFLPMDLISRLLYYTVSFYAIRLIYSGLKISFRSGFLKKIISYITNIFGGFTGGGSDSGGSDSGDNGGNVDV